MSATRTTIRPPKGMEPIGWGKPDLYPRQVVAKLQSSYRRSRRAVAQLPETSSSLDRAPSVRNRTGAVEAAVWFSDLRNFTMLTELLPATEVLATLNAYLELVEGVVCENSGEVLCLTGDALLIAFPASNNRSVNTACAASLDAALACLEILASLNEERAEASKPPIDFGIGLDVGEITSGQIRLNKGLDRATVGRSVNRAARLEGLTKTLGISLLLSEAFVAHTDRPVRSLGRFPLKGIAEPQLVYALSELRWREQASSHEPDRPTVFIVDDDPAIRDSLTLLFDSHGIAVQSYACAETFLKAYRPGRPGCLILDQSMPGLNGLELQNALSANGCDFPIIFLTGQGDISTSVQAVKAGAVDFLEKPVRAELLLERVEEALGCDVGTSSTTHEP